MRKEESSNSVRDTRVIILGANGMLGRYVHKLYILSNIYKTVIPITRSDFDFGQSSDVVYNYLLGSIQPNDLIINCIGMINKRDSFSPELELQFYRINAVLPRLLAQVCTKNNGYLIHITTDCVFDGTEPWKCRTDPHNSIDLYGMTKSLGDCSIRGYPNVSILRTSIIGEESNGRSLVEWVISGGSRECISSRMSACGNTLSSTLHAELNGYINHMWNGVTCLKLAEIIVYKIRIPTDNVTDDFYDFFGKEMVITGDLISKHDLIKLIVEVYDVDVKVIAMLAPTERNMQLSGNVHSKDNTREQLLKMKEFDVLGRR